MTVSRDQLLLDLCVAYLQARKHKRNKGSQLGFEYNLESELLLLRAEIWDRSYSPSPADCFVVQDPVLREIYSSRFRDRVVHHLLYNYISPHFERKFIYDSYSCRKGKGTSAGIARLQHHIRACTDNYRYDGWILKLDIKSYFTSINQQLLYDTIMEDLSLDKDSFDMDLISFLLRVIIFRDPSGSCRHVGSDYLRRQLPISKSLSSSPDGVGLPIGDLTSQLFSNIYLNSFDQWMKRTLKIKYYGRYVDDFFIIHRDRAFLESLIPQISDFLKTRLGLTLHPLKIVLNKVSDGVEFLGSYVSPYCVRPSQRCVRNYTRSIQLLDATTKFGALPDKQILSSLNARLGYISQFRSYKLKYRTLHDAENLLRGFRFRNDLSAARILSMTEPEFLQLWKHNAGASGSVY